jgi:hypothetical protein
VHALDFKSKCVGTENEKQTFANHVCLFAALSFSSKENMPRKVENEISHGYIS